MKYRMLRVAAIGALALFLSASAAQAQRFDLGLRGDLMLADGEPSNDIPGYGAFGHYRFNDRWSIGFAVDVSEHDFEQPARILGLVQDTSVEPLDSVAETVEFRLWLQRTYQGSGSRFGWFWGVGLGAVSLDVTDVSGPLAGSGTFDIETDAGTEILVSLSAGFQWDFVRPLFLEFAGRVEQHFADWQVTDRVSGATATIDDYLTYGGHLGLGFRF